MYWRVTYFKLNGQDSISIDAQPVVKLVAFSGLTKLGCNTQSSMCKEYEYCIISPSPYQMLCVLPIELLLQRIMNTIHPLLPHCFCNINLEQIKNAFKYGHCIILNGKTPIAFHCSPGQQLFIESKSSKICFNLSRPYSISTICTQLCVF